MPWYDQRTWTVENQVIPGCEIDASSDPGPTAYQDADLLTVRGGQPPLGQFDLGHLGDHQAHGLQAHLGILVGLDYASRFRPDRLDPCRVDPCRVDPCRFEWSILILHARVIPTTAAVHTWAERADDASCRRTHAGGLRARSPGNNLSGTTQASDGLVHGPSPDLDTALSPRVIMPNEGKLHQTKTNDGTAGGDEGSSMETAHEERDRRAPAEPVRVELRVIEGGRAGSVPSSRGPGQLTLPLTWQVGGIAAEPPAPAYLRVVRDEDERTELAATAQGRPHPIAWAAQIARAVYEVAQGERPASQLRRHVARDQLATLAIRGVSYARHPAARSAHGMSRLRQVRAVRCCLVAPGIVEASAVLVGAGRSHAVALRLEARPGSWLVTAVDFR